MMIVAGYVPVLRLLYNVLLLGEIILVVALLTFRIFRKNDIAEGYYLTIRDNIHKHSTINFTVICLILASGFASNFAFTELQGISMEPNFKEGQLVIVRHHRYKLERGDLLVIRLDKETDVLKRLIGLPGDRIEMPRAGGVIVNREPLDERAYLNKIIENEMEIEMIIPKDEVFVLGDNRKDSYDSREHGGFSKDKILGKVVLNLGTPPKFLMKLWHGI